MNQPWCGLIDSKNQIDLEKILDFVNTNDNLYVLMLKLKLGKQETFNWLFELYEYIHLHYSS